MIGIVDYGMGNLLSVQHAIESLGAEVKVCRTSSDLEDVSRIVLPGVGAFRDCMAQLTAKNFVPALRRGVLETGKPFLGICLGMQALAKISYENGEYPGLGWMDAQVVKLAPSDKSLRIPHIGWDTIKFDDKNPIFKGVSANSDVYFVHSYYVSCTNSAEVAATFDYGGTFTAAIRKQNIFGTQFHPEKSQDVGLRILQNFLSWNG